MGGTRRVGSQSVDDAAAVGKIRSAFAVEVGQKMNASGGGRNRGDLAFHFIEVPAEPSPDPLGHHGDVHGAGEREPVVGAVAKGGDLALGIDDGFFGAAVESARGAEARGDDAVGDIARAFRNAKMAGLYRPIHHLSLSGSKTYEIPS